MSKGSKYRPITNKGKFNENWKKIFAKESSGKVSTQVQQTTSRTKQEIQT